jgi:monovalent cation:H+ antiporter-2, CPA2 family
MSIEEANIRSLTGVTVLSIERVDGEEITYPNGRVYLLNGDRCLVVGSPEEKVAFDQLIRGEIALPVSNTPCQWLVIPEDSPAVGESLQDLDFSRQYGVTLRALRRDGKLTSEIELQTKLDVGDRLLLCGGQYPLRKLQQRLAPKIPVSPTVQVSSTDS